MSAQVQQTRRVVNKFAEKIDALMGKIDPEWDEVAKGQWGKQLAVLLVGGRLSSETLHGRLN